MLQKLDDSIRYLVEVTDPEYFLELEFIDSVRGYHDENDCLVIRVVSTRRKNISTT